MGNLGGLEVVVVLLVALVVLGPEKLPEAVRKVGNVLGELRRVSKSFQDEMRSAAMLDDNSVEADARKKGDDAVAASKADQASMEPAGRSLTEDTAPFKNTDPGESTGDTENTGSTGSTENTANTEGTDETESVETAFPVDAAMLDTEKFGDDDPLIESDA